jgi:hypothetical protein
MVSPGTISRYMAERFEVDQFQIVQEGATSFVLRVVLGETVYAAEQFVAALGGILGAAGEGGVRRRLSQPGRREVPTGDLPLRTRRRDLVEAIVNGPIMAHWTRSRRKGLRAR